MLPRNLVTAHDSEQTLMLFAETLRLAEAATADRERASIVPPGALWLLLQHNPSREQLFALLAGVVPPGWPAWFERNRLTGGPLREAFQHCLENGANYGIESGYDLCRLLAAVSQTLYSTNSELVRRNRGLADRPPPPDERPPEWLEQDVFVSHRPDEHGGYLAAGNIRLWLASHIGPSSGYKAENQDAVYATRCGAGLCFALADGVGTSLGSRYAAAVAAFRFCDEVVKSCLAAHAGDVLITAARNTQQAMDAMFERLLANPGGAERLAVMQGSELQAEAAQMIFENTRTVKRSYLQAALATTLIGGYLRPGEHDGEFVGAVICIGDGAVETIDADGSLHPIQATDPEETAIDMWMGPGLRSREALQSGAAQVHPFSLSLGQYLLLSSDGLTRGHGKPVWSKVNELAGDIPSRLQPGQPDAAAALLRDLATAAERSQDGERLFEDNLSLILVTAG